MSAGSSGSLHDMSEINATEPDLVDVTAATTAVIRGVVGMADMVSFFDGSFGTVASVLAEQEVPVAGAAFALFHGRPTDRADLEVGFVTDGAVRPQDDVRSGELPGGRVARLVHVGGYDQLGSSWDRLGSWIAGRGLTPGGELWEVYVTEPSPDMDPADLRTELNWLLAT